MGEFMKKTLLYGMDAETTEQMRLILEASGAKVHLLKNEELHQVLLDVLEAEEKQEYEVPKYNMTVCIFAGYSKDEIYEAIDMIRAANIKRPVFATVTQKNIHWKIGAMITDVNMEHEEMQKMNQKSE